VQKVITRIIVVVIIIIVIVILNKQFEEKRKQQETLSKDKLIELFLENENRFNRKIWAGYDGLELGTELDVKIMDENTGEISYIYAIAGDIKAHTYDNGVVQTGQPYPNSWNATHEGYVDPGYDRSSIEFIRTSDSTNMNQYSIVEIIVKDK
jgi:hypothetical protein